MQAFRSWWSAGSRWTSQVFIAGYLLLLAFGIACHTLSVNTGLHVGMYFLLWDMYPGWSSFEERHHLLAEGESGAYYLLNPAPWGELIPFGEVGRTQYDLTTLYANHLAFHALRHTDHEPISRVILVDEVWPKKYNLPDRLWGLRHAEPKEPHSYFYTRAGFDAEGRPISRFYSWQAHLAHQALVDNPRLQAEIARAQPYRPIDSMTSSRDGEITQAAYFLPPR